MKNKFFQIVLKIPLIFIFAITTTCALCAPGKRTYKGSDASTTVQQINNEINTLISENEKDEVPVLASNEPEKTIDEDNFNNKIDNPIYTEKFNQSSEESNKTALAGLHKRPEALMNVIQKQQLSQNELKSEQITPDAVKGPMYYEISHSHIQLNEKYKMKE